MLTHFGYVTLIIEETFSCDHGCAGHLPRALPCQGTPVSEISPQFRRRKALPPCCSPSRAVFYNATSLHSQTKMWYYELTILTTAYRNNLLHEKDRRQSTLV